MLACRTSVLGFHLFTCPTCEHQIKVYHSCKSRFCSSCGKKATDKWVQEKFDMLPNTPWQHITFTMPSILWNLFWVNRHLIGLAPKLAADIILKEARLKNALPGIFLAIHTFGRDLKRNMHFHLSTTVGGLNIFNSDLWVKKVYYHHEKLKTQWRYNIIDLLRQEYLRGNIKMSPALKHITDYKQFNKLLNELYKQSWVVQLNKTDNNHKHNVEYLGRYIKRPPLGETKILNFQDNMVTFKFLDHYTGETETKTLPALDFIGKLVSHIHDENFRAIRYYGFLANRIIGKLLPIVKTLVKHIVKLKIKKIDWRSLYTNTFGIDPLKCLKCGTIMLLEDIILPIKIPLTQLQELIANDKIDKV